MSTTESAPERTERRVQEGPRNYLISYGVSLVLTLLAFAAVMYGDLNKTFIIVLLILFAVVQILFQIIFWMHLKERNHQVPIISIAFGAFIGGYAVIAGIYWMWW